MEDRIAKHEFTSDELVQAEKLIPERMDDIEDSMVESMVDEETKTASDQTKTFFDQIKKSTTTGKKIKEQAITHFMKTAEGETEEEKRENATERFDSLAKKVQKGEKLDATESKDVKIIGKQGFAADERADPEDKINVSRTLSGGSDEGKKYEALANALDSLREAMDKQVEEGKDPKEVSTIKLQEGTVFQAVLSPDLKTITMRAE